MSLPPPSLRRALLRHRPGRGKLYAPDVQAGVVEFARVRRDEGASYKQVATELGLRFETVRRWCMGAVAARTLKRVEIVDDSRASRVGVCIVCPSGHRLEGLTLEDAITVLRALA
jgi:hypothetical protein